VTVDSKPNILIVDDRKENLIALSAVLEDVDADIIQASSGGEALGLLLEYNFALVLLDVQMPEMDGYEVANIMSQSPSTQNIPIIFLTAISKDEQNIIKGYTSGAVDFITKPLNTEILLSKVGIFLRLWSQNNELLLLSLKYQGAMKELEAQRDELKEMTIKDYLTGLYQRRVFDELLIKEISQSVRHNTYLSLAMLDLDYFKKVNDTYGHSVGDEVLVKVSAVFMDLVRGSDIVSRYGGEEFVILMPDTHLNDAVKSCERIRSSIENLKFETDKGKLEVTISIGVAEFHLNAEKKLELMTKRADECLYQAKDQGRNCVYPKVIEDIDE